MAKVIAPVWPDLAKSLAILAKSLKSWATFYGLFTFWENFGPTLANFWTIGQVFNHVNGQMCENNPAI